jgi:hypothetical protein
LTSGNGQQRLAKNQNKPLISLAFFVFLAGNDWQRLATTGSRKQVFAMVSRWVSSIEILQKSSIPSIDDTGWHGTCPVACTIFASDIFFTTTPTV